MGMSNIEDALGLRMDGTTEGMTLQVLAQIRDSLSAMSRDIRQNNEATSDVRERVIRLEERDKRLDVVESSIKTLDGRVDALLKDKDRRDGALGLMGAIRVWAPSIGMVASILAAAWLYGRSLGVVPAPPVRQSHHIEHRQGVPVSGGGAQ